MPKLRQIFAVVLVLTLWFGATQHCNLEAAGVIEHAAAGDSCCPDNSGSAADCHGDGCKIVESASYRSFSVGKLAPAPDQFVCACAIGLSLSAPAPDDSQDLPGRFATVTSPSWVTAWTFVRRAAPLSRAPSLVA